MLHNNDVRLGGSFTTGFTTRQIVNSIDRRVMAGVNARCESERSEVHSYMKSVVAQ